MKSFIIAKVCRAPEDYNKGNKSFAQIRDESGWDSEQIEIKDIEAYVNKHPGIVDKWESFSDDLRSSSIWIFHLDIARNLWCVSYDENEKNFFQEKQKACAFYIFKFFTQFSEPRHQSKISKVAHFAKEHFEKSKDPIQFLHNAKIKKKDLDVDWLSAYLHYHPELVLSWQKYEELNPGKKEWQTLPQGSNNIEKLSRYIVRYFKYVISEQGRANIS